MCGSKEIADLIAASVEARKAARELSKEIRSLYVDRLYYLRRWEELKNDTKSSTVALIVVSGLLDDTNRALFRAARIEKEALEEYAAEIKAIKQGIARNLRRLRARDAGL